MMTNRLQVMIAAMFTGAVVCAGEASVASGAGAETLLTSSLVMSILKGAFMGVIATLIGWLKNTEPGKFEWKGLALKLPIGFVVGAIAAWKGIDFAAAYDWALGIGLITLIDNLVKLVIRRIHSAWGWEVMNDGDAGKNPQ